MRKPQNNSDQSAFHLSAAHIDVQTILLMAVLEENRKWYMSLRQSDTQHKHCQKICFHEDIQITSFHSSIYAPLQVTMLFSPAGSSSCFWGNPSGASRPILTCGLFTESQVCTQVSSQSLIPW